VGQQSSCATSADLTISLLLLLLLLPLLLLLLLVYPQHAVHLLLLLQLTAQTLSLLAPLQTSHLLRQPMACSSSSSMHSGNHMRKQLLLLSLRHMCSTVECDACVLANALCVHP
jgi:hypothetical protein